MDIGVPDWKIKGIFQHVQGKSIKLMKEEEARGKLNTISDIDPRDPFITVRFAMGQFESQL